MGKTKSAHDAEIARRAVSEASNELIAPLPVTSAAIRWLDVSTIRATEALLIQEASTAVMAERHSISSRAGGD